MNNDQAQLSLEYCENDENKKTETCFEKWQLDDLQLQTLSRIGQLCPRPSKTVIDMISHQMKLSRSCVIDFFVRFQHLTSAKTKKFLNV